MLGKVSAVSCRALIAYAAARNQPTEQWLRNAGLTLAELEDPETRLAPEAIFALWRLAYEAMSDPGLALHVAASLPRGAYRVVEYLAAHAPTLGAAYTKVAEYFSVIDATTALVIVEWEDELAFGPKHTSRDPSSYPAVEYMLAACHLRVRDMTEVAHAPLRVEFTSPRQAHAPEVERIFGCPASWNAGFDRLHFARSDWIKPTKQADSELFLVLEDHARVLRERHPSSVSLLDALDAALDGALAEGEVSLEHVARKLGMSSRTLQRRLEEQGAAFSDRVDEARKRAALHWLIKTDVSLSEVAYLVGFKEQASLTRAVRRWTGRSPREIRQG
jgi:AraC-like DNA-binding protein